MAADGVEVHLFAAARAAVGQSLLVVPPGRLEAILDRLATDHPGFAAVRPRCSYLMDGISTRDEQTEIPSGARLDILPPFAGG